MSRVLGIALLSLGAAGPVVPVAAQQAKDSAGIRIIDNATPQKAGARQWAVEARPVLAIGVAEGDEQYMFHNVTGAALLPDGGIAVVNRGSYQVRFYDRQGRAVRATGREGAGPFEFRTMGGPYWCNGDALFIRDQAQDRFVSFAPDGTPQTTMRQPMPRGWTMASSAITCDRSGALLQVGWGLRDGIGPGVWRPDSPVVITDLEGAIVRDLGTWPGSDRERFDASDGPRRMGRMMIVALSGRTALIGTGDGPEFNLIDVNTGARRIVRWRQDDRRIDAGVKDAYLREMLAAVGEGARERTTRTLERFDYPANLPPYTQAIVDAEGYFWIQVFRRPGDPISRLHVFSPDGIWVTDVHMPTRVQVFDVGKDVILGRVVDDDGVESVRVYRYRRG